MFSDPKSGSEEPWALVQRAVPGLRLKDKREDFDLIFQGAGTRWTGELVQPEHPAHALYEAVKDQVLASGGCADVFCAAPAAESSGTRLVRDANVPGTTGPLDLSKYLDGGSRLVIF